MHVFKKSIVSTALMSGFIAVAVSACGGQQSPLTACATSSAAGAKLLPDLHAAIMETSSDPAGTLKKFQDATDSFRDATKSVSNAQVKAQLDVVNKDLDSLINAIKDIDAAAKSGKSQDDLHDMVVEKVQPLANTFQQDWNEKLSAACGAK